VFVKDVPACGYKTVSIDKYNETKSSDKNTLDTPFYTVEFDLERGGISSLVNKKTGKELVDTNSEFVLGQFMHERFSVDNWMGYLNAYIRWEAGFGLHDFGKPGMSEDIKYAKVVPSDWTISIVNSDSRDVVTLTAGDTKGLAKAFSMAFTFPRNAPSVEVEWTVDTKTPKKTPEGGWLCMPFALEDPTFTVGRSGGPIDPAKDIIPGANRNLLAVMSGVSVKGSDGSGMGVCPLDSPLVSLGIPGIYQYSLDYVPTEPVVFINLYNNEWNTNFPLWIEGSWSERVKVWPIGKGSVTEDLAVQSWEARMPLLAAQATGKKGTLPKSRQGLSLSRKGVLVTAFGKDPYGAEGTLLRVWEQAGKSGKITAKLPKGMKVSKATPVNLRGEISGKAIKVSFGKLKFNLGKYAPASFILE
jgi:alpha-mannosidase